MYKVLYIGIWHIFKIYSFCFCQNTSKNNKRYYAFKRFLVIFMVGNWFRIIVACILQQYIAHKNSNFNSITENIDVVLYFTPAITKHCVNVEYIFNDYKNKCLVNNYFWYTLPGKILWKKQMFILIVSSHEKCLP